MKLVFIDYYDENSSVHKDPITIPQSLKLIGHEVELITRCETNLNLIFGFKLKKLTDWLNEDLLFSKPDVVIAISRFDPKLTNALKIIKDKNIPLIIKGDTDGTIGYPLIPNYLRTKPILKNPLNILRHVKWRYRYSYAVKKKIDQIKLADFVICESPNALINLRKFFDYWKLNKARAVFIPNPVSDLCISTKLTKKAPKIVAIGRWDDVECKGSDLLAEVIAITHENLADYEFVVIGNCPESTKSLLFKSCPSNLSITGSLSFEDTQKILSTAQILIVPSRLESFSLVTAEALCLGVSVVVTPIESLQYLAGDGRFGSVALNFKSKSLAKALISEVAKHKENLRDPEVISSYWRDKLSISEISPHWDELFSKIRQLSQ